MLVLEAVDSDEPMAERPLRGGLTLGSGSSSGWRTRS